MTLALLAQSINVNGIQYVTEHAAVILILTAFIAGLVIGIWLERIERSLKQK